MFAMNWHDCSLNGHVFGSIIVVILQRWSVYFFPPLAAPNAIAETNFKHLPHKITPFGQAIVDLVSHTNRLHAVPFAPTSGAETSPLIAQKIVACIEKPFFNTVLYTVHIVSKQFHSNTQKHTDQTSNYVVKLLYGRQ